MDEQTEAVLMRAGFVQERLNTEVFALKRTITAKDREIARLLAALTEVAKAEGAYNRDPRIHAENVIDNMVCIATKALAPAKGEDKP